MDNLKPELSVGKHHLPHWRIGGHIYFVTTNSILGFLPPEALQIVVDTIREGENMKFFHLHVGVIMANHFHLLLQPLEVVPDKEWYSLSRITKGIKGASARRINELLNRTGSIWNKESYDRVVRDEAEFNQKWWYIVTNPVRAKIVNLPEEYPYLIFSQNQ